MLFKFQWQIEKLSQEFLFLGPGLSSLSPQTNKISSTKTKRNTKLKKQKTGAPTRTYFFLKYLALDVALKIPTSTHYCLLLIDIISNGDPYQWTLITILNVK